MMWTTAVLVTISLRSGYNFREGTESGHANKLKATHLITNKRLGTTVFEL